MKDDRVNVVDPQILEGFLDRLLDLLSYRQTMIVW